MKDYFERLVYWHLHIKDRMKLINSLDIKQIPMHELLYNGRFASR